MHSVSSIIRNPLPQCIQNMSSDSHRLFNEILEGFSEKQIFGTDTVFGTTEFTYWS